MDGHGKGGDLVSLGGLSPASLGGSMFHDLMLPLPSLSHVDVRFTALNIILLMN